MTEKETEKNPSVTIVSGDPSPDDLVLLRATKTLLEENMPSHDEHMPRALEAMVFPLSHVDELDPTPWSANRVVIASAMALRDFSLKSIVLSSHAASRVDVAGVYIDDVEVTGRERNGSFALMGEAFSEECWRNNPMVLDMGFARAGQRVSMKLVVKSGSLDKHAIGAMLAGYGMMEHEEQIACRGAMRGAWQAGTRVTRGLLALPRMLCDPGETTTAVVQCERWFRAFELRLSADSARAFSLVSESTSSGLGFRASDGEMPGYVYSPAALRSPRLWLRGEDAGGKITLTFRNVSREQASVRAMLFGVHVEQAEAAKLRDPSASAALPNAATE